MKPLSIRGAIVLILMLTMVNCGKNNTELFVSHNVIKNNYLGDEWVKCIQTVANNNVFLDNGQLLLGNIKYQAISFSGYRKDTRGNGLSDMIDYCPTIVELKEDMRIMAAMGVKLLRTYDTQLYYHAPRLLEAIHQLKMEDKNFEMYVMLGAWIQCTGAYTENVDHSVEDNTTNKAEMDKAIELAALYPNIVKIIAVGNEAMVKWQAHWVNADIILKWVRYAKAAKATPVNGYLLPEHVLLTSSDNFAVWGAEEGYRNEDLIQLIQEVDYISIHTYPFHDSHYNPDFWQITKDDADKSDDEKVTQSMTAAFQYAVNQYKLVKSYIHEIGDVKPIHIGETGWATVDDKIYTTPGSGVTDEIKLKMYYDAMNQWCFENNVSCFFFEAFDEPWKGGKMGAESHFGIFAVDGKAKFPLWNLVDKGVFKNLTRGGNPIIKTYNGDYELLHQDMLVPPVKNE